jgi:hypothetical protein
VAGDSQEAGAAMRIDQDDLMALLSAIQDFGDLVAASRMELAGAAILSKAMLAVDLAVEQSGQSGKKWTREQVLSLIHGVRVRRNQ